MAETPSLQPVRPAVTDATDFRVAAPFSFLPSQTMLYSSLAEGTYAPQPSTVDYDQKVIEWVPPTPDAPPAADAAAAAWEAPAGLPRPQPHKPEAAMMQATSSSSSEPSPSRLSRSESPIDVVSTSAFAPVEATTRSDDAPHEIARPQPLRVDALDAGSVNPLLILASESQQQQQQQTPTITLASAFGLPSDTVIMSTAEQPGPSSADSSNVSPPSRGCYTRAPGLGPPPETPTSDGHTSSGYVCTICGFSCASKFHYNSHMNTHGDHQCSMCDYTSRTEGRLKKHMRDSHTAEEQLAAGLELKPASVNNTPTKDGAAATPMELEVDGDGSPSSAIGLPSPRTLSSTLLGMIATSTASSMSSALEQMRSIAEQPLMGDGSTEGLLLVGTPLGLSLPMREDGMGGGGGGGRRKMKVFKCKQCEHISQSKEERWQHARSHIPCDKQMSCSKCNFVTEYKHHLEYHMRNHDGVKPFQCKKCAYTCVNKSMLNSHMKSHSNVYQFRCADCNYATKYCHSLKLHLKKYAHRRNTEGLSEADLLISMSAESSPPSMRKDSTASIASSLSGPFTPFGLVKREEPTTPLATPQMPSFTLPIATSQSLNYATQMLLRQHQFEQMQQQQRAQTPALKCCLCDFSCGGQEELLRHNMTHLMAGGMANGSIYQALGIQASLGIPDRSAEDDHHTTTGSPSGDDAVSHSNGSAGSPLGSGRGSGDEGESGSSRRKSKAPSRIDEIGMRLIDKASPDTTVKEEVKDEAMDTTDASATVDITASSEQLVLPQLPAPQPIDPSMQQQMLQAQLAQLPSGGLLAAAMVNANNINNAVNVDNSHSSNGMPDMSALRQAYLAHLVNQTRTHPAHELFQHQCRHCTLGFGNPTIYQLHMSFHSPENPLQCARCGLVCASALHFNLHLLQTQHI